MTVPTLRTERLILRQIEPSDAESLHPTLSDPETMQWWSTGPHKSLAETQTYVARNSERGEGWRCWAITRDGGGAMGWVVLIEKRAAVQEVGYILDRRQWGQGLAREAVGRVIDHAFSTLALRRVFADTDPENGASIRLLEGLGFRREGHLRAEWETHIGIRDSIIFGLLRADWKATPTGALT